MINEEKNTFLLGFTFEVHIKNPYLRKKNQEKRIKEMKSDLVKKIYQIAFAKGIETNDLYNFAESEGFNRFLKRNTVTQLELFVERIKSK